MFEKEAGCIHVYSDPKTKKGLLTIVKDGVPGQPFVYPNYHQAKRAAEKKALSLGLEIKGGDPFDEGMFEKDTKVQVIEKNGYKKILRVGEVGMVDSVEDKTVSVKFEDGEVLDYTAELLVEIEEKDEFQQIEVAVFSSDDSEVKELSSSTSESRLPEAVMRAIELAICEAMHGDYSACRFDDISIVVSESDEGKLERAKLEGELKTELVGEIAEDTKAKAKRAALIGIDVAKLEAESDEAKAVLDEAKVVPPPIRLEKFVGKEVIVELMGGGLYRGRLARGPWTANMFQVTNRAGTYKFSVKDVERLLTK